MGDACCGCLPLVFHSLALRLPVLHKNLRRKCKSLARLLVCHSLLIFSDAFLFEWVVTPAKAFLPNAYQKASYNAQLRLAPAFGYT